MILFWGNDLIDKNNYDEVYKLLDFIFSDVEFVLVKDGGAKLWLVLSAIYMFVFLTNEHIAANFASFAIVKFSVAADSIANFGIGNILRHWGVTFIGNFIGGGLLIGLPYAFLNKNEDTYVD